MKMVPLQFATYIISCNSLEFNRWREGWCKFKNDPSFCQEYSKVEYKWYNIIKDKQVE